MNGILFKILRMVKFNENIFFYFFFVANEEFRIIRIIDLKIKNISENNVLY